MNINQKLLVVKNEYVNEYIIYLFVKNKYFIY